MPHVTELRARSPQHLRLPFSPESARVARHALEEWLDAAGTDGLRDDCRLVVSELVGNAVRHARPLADGTVGVRWSCVDDELAISVTDGGTSGQPHRVDAGPSDPSGRGLAIVEALSDRWWIERSRAWTTVHTVLALA